MNAKKYGRLMAFCLLCAVCILSLGAANANATPVKPNIEKLAEEAQQPRPFFIPSRVGWNGSEMERAGQNSGSLEASMAPVLAAQRERQFRATWWEIVTPEPTAVLGIAGIIFLLRKLRSLREEQAMPPQRQPQAA